MRTGEWLGRLGGWAEGLGEWLEGLEGESSTFGGGGGSWASSSVTGCRSLRLTKILYYVL